MTKYQIIRRSTGFDLGVYEATDEQGALDACAKDAGYADYADACEVTGDDSCVLVAVEVDAATAVIDERS